MNFTIADTIKEILSNQGRTQALVIKKMNDINPELNMDKNKFSAITNQKRKMSGDELLAFCMALEVNPDNFMKRN